MKNFGRMAGNIERVSISVVCSQVEHSTIVHFTAGEADAVDTMLDDSLSTRFIAGSGAFFRVRGACPPFLPLPDGIP